MRLRLKGATFLCTLMALCVAACQKTPPPLKGKREDVFIPQETHSGQKIGKMRLVSSYKEYPYKGWLMPNLTLENNQTPISILKAHGAAYKGWSNAQGEEKDAYALMSPVVANERLFFVSGKGALFCLGTQKGGVVWFHPLSPPSTSFVLGGGCTFHKGRLYATSTQGHCYCFEAATGKVLWHQKTGQLLRGAPKVSEGRVFLMTARNQLDVLSTIDGKPLWSHQGVPEELQFLGSSLPAISGDDVVICYSSGEIYKLSVKTGRVLWSYVISPDVQVEELSKIPHIVASPIICQGVIYVTASFQKMVALDSSSGTLLWERPLGGMETPVIVGEDIFLIQKDRLLRVDRRTGRVWWSKALVTTDDPEKASKESHLWMGPLVLNRALYVLSDCGVLRAFDMETGRDRGVVASLETPCSLRPIAAAEHIFVLTKHCVVQALKSR